MATATVDNVIFGTALALLMCQYAIIGVFFVVDYLDYVKNKSNGKPANPEAINLMALIPFWWVPHYLGKFFSYLGKFRKNVGGNSFISYIRETYGKDKN